MTLPTRRQTIPFAPISGPSGYSLIGYAWQYDLEEYVDFRGEDRVRKVSDWSRAEVAAVTGREIVHQFSVVTPDGRGLLVSLESAAKLLGFSKGDAGEKAVKSIASSVKTLAKLRMEWASIEAQNRALDAKNAEHAADLERVTAEYKGRMPVVTLAADNSNFQVLEMDGVKTWHCLLSSNGSAYDRQEYEDKLERLRQNAVSWKMRALGHTNGSCLAGVSYGDLAERIAKLERKIAKGAEK
jgi:hypothetical protein